MRISHFLIVSAVTISLHLLPITKSFAESDGPDVTASHKTKIFLTALSFSRGLAALAQGGDKLTVLLVGSCDTADEMSATEGKKVSGLTLHYERIAAGDGAALEKKGGTGIAFFCDDSRAAANTLQPGEGRKWLTLADRPDMVETGSLLGVEVRNGRPTLLLNGSLAKAAGIEFDPRFYTFARVIK